MRLHGGWGRPAIIFLGSHHGYGGQIVRMVQSRTSGRVGSPYFWTPAPGQVRSMLTGAFWGGVVVAAAWVRAVSACGVVGGG